jgi:hypothetical protein
MRPCPGAVQIFYRVPLTGGARGCQRAPLTSQRRPGSPLTGSRRRRPAGGRGCRRRTGRQDARATGPAIPPYCGLVYEHDPADVEELGWEEFIARQWDSIFVGYRSWTGLRKLGRRWSDLIEAGLGCSQELADQLVKAEVIERPDRDLEGAADAWAVVSGMVGVLADLRADLAELAGQDGLGPELSARLLDRHARLMSFVRAYALGSDDDQAPVP